MAKDTINNSLQLEKKQNCFLSSNEIEIYKEKLLSDIDEIAKCPSFESNLVVQMDQAGSDGWEDRTYDFAFHNAISAVESGFSARNAVRKKKLEKRLDELEKKSFTACCKFCGQQIPLIRLLTVPETDTCQKHA